MNFVRGVMEEAEHAGFRFGDRGTHTSRTIMLEDLSAALETASPTASRADYATAIVEDNCLAKATLATRRLSDQRLSELYALDSAVPLFRVLRRLWAVDEEGRPLVAILAALARDPLLAASAAAVISLQIGEDLSRDRMRQAIRMAVGTRLNDATLDKVVRNAASSWAQAGHLAGRTFKKRRLVVPTTAAVAFALYLGHAAGFRGEDLFGSPWLQVIDCPPRDARAMALEAKRLGLIDARAAGDVFELGFQRLDPWTTRA